MEKKTSILVIAMLFLVSTALLKAGPTVQASGVNDGSSPPGSYYLGTVDTGTYIKAGINDYGALGVGTGSDPGDGFQYPIGSDYESLAVGWWSDGWSVFYGLAAADFEAGFSPSDDAWGTISGVTPTVTSTATSYGYLHTITMTTSDGQLELTFKVEFFNNEKYLKIEAYIKNVGTSAITDLEYKRLVDWDVWRPINPGLSGDDTDNYYGMDDIRKPGLNLAVAFLNSTIMGSTPPNTVYMGLASLETPNGYDLDWDDLYSRGLADPQHGSLSADGIASYVEDVGVLYDYLLGTLNPGQTKAVHNIYAAGDSLNELEGNVQKALSQYPAAAPVGGYMVPVNKLELLAPWIALASVVSVAGAVAVAWKKGKR